MHVLKDFSALAGFLSRFEPSMIVEHLKLYEGYVNKYNEICVALTTTEKKGNYSYAPHSELVRRKSVAWNGAKLHELYFEALSSSGSPASAELTSVIEKSFGSMEIWKQDLIACASATPGWVLLAQNQDEGVLEHYVVFEHQNNVPVGVNILLALDCWEHAFAKQYGTNKIAYLETFFAHLDFAVVSSRLK